jgi:sigma-B regulation protein RsbU (phosphoserine phosphatase)
MEEHNGMFFTIWYGVYNIPKREIVYSSGGHPPAVLITGPTASEVRIHELRTPGLVIGGMPKVEFSGAACRLDKYAKLYLFSDGVYEIGRENGETFSLQEFIQFLREPSSPEEEDLDRIVRVTRELNGPGSFADDFSILEIKFD